jgi:Cu/Ag efflux pump CusA
MFKKSKNSKPADTDNSNLYKSDGQDKLLPRLGVFVYNHARVAALVWAILILFGAASYSVFLKREGFPSVNIPITVINGSYLANNPAKVDADVAKPLSDIVLKDPRVKSVQAVSRANFYNLIIQYIYLFNAARLYAAGAQSRSSAGGRLH